MFRSVFLKSLRDQYRGLIGWSIGLGAIVATMTALWPSIRDMPDLEKLMKNYPESFQKLFDIDSIATGDGYLNAELFSIMLPALFIVFAVSRGARLTVGEERAGTMEVLLVTPVPRIRVLLEKAAALGLSTVVLGVALFLTTAASSAIVGMGIGVGDLASACLAMVLIGIEHGFLALAVGAATGRRALAIAIPGSIAVAGYVLYITGQLVEAVEPWQVLSPFYQAIEGGPIGAGLPLAYLWLLAGGAVAIAAALRPFDRRDVSA